MSVFFSEFLDHKLYNQNLSIKTISGYKQSFSSLSAYLPNLDDLSIYSDHKKWKYALARLSEFRKWSPVTYNTNRKRYTTFCEFLISEGYILENPFKKIPKMKQPLSLPKTYSLLQVGRIKQAVIDIFSGHDYLSKRNRAIILVLLYTGIRRDELLNLTIPQIDILGKTILIYRGKGNKDRVVPIPDVLYPHIERFALLRNQTFFNRESDFFFASKNGAQLTEKNLYLIFKKIKEKTGFDVTTHRFRHTYATELIRNDINLYNVSKILGHSDVRITEVYLSANVQKIAANINAMNMYS